MDDLLGQLVAGIRAQRKPEAPRPISRDEAYAAYADALGRSVETLTKDEKGAALMAHVMEKLG